MYHAPDQFNLVTAIYWIADNINQSNTTMNKIELLLKQLHENPLSVEFEDVIDVIDSAYHYTPVRFTNGPVDGQPAEFVINNAGENTGSCKIFAFALKHGLNESETLQCFGRYYRDDVLNNPAGSDHANIRTFMNNGWQHIVFDKPALYQQARTRLSADDAEDQ